MRVRVRVPVRDILAAARLAERDAEAGLGKRDTAAAPRLALLLALREGKERVRDVERERVRDVEREREGDATAADRQLVYGSANRARLFLIVDIPMEFATGQNWQQTDRHAHRHSGHT